MAANVRIRSDFAETFAVHAALKLALSRKLYASDARAQKAATGLVKALEGDRSIYGRQLKMIGLMTKGATIQQMVKTLHCSRRTIFRYLNHLDAAGIGVTLEDGRYRVPKNLLKLVKK
ncbi:MAG: HTH domain-containing protein [bacterium]|nr:HTH domain-containing protein [bacterium]